jgi:prepilin-type N-terminal cleavage/methylation domain-containing protein
MARTRHSLGAFTLLEMAIVIAIIAVILAGGAVTFSASVKQKQFDQTKEKMAVLQKALRDYWRTFGRLPCPADIVSYSLAESNFGVEAENKGSCDGTPAATFFYNIDLDSIAGPALCSYNEVTHSYSDATHDNCIYLGMIPVRTLQLPDDYAFDGWGRRLSYVVHSDFTLPNASADLGVTSDVDNGTTRIIVKSDALTNKTQAAAYALLSHGMNGHGAYPRHSQVGTLRVNSGSANTMELGNCHCDNIAEDQGLTNTFYQAPYSTNTASVTDTFDDLLVFGTRGNLASAKE